MKFFSHPFLAVTVPEGIQDTEIQYPEHHGHQTFLGFILQIGSHGKQIAYKKQDQDPQVGHPDIFFDMNQSVKHQPRSKKKHGPHTDGNDLFAISKIAGGKDHIKVKP